MFDSICDNTNTRCDNDGSGFLERGEFREVCAGLGIAKVFHSNENSDDNSNGDSNDNSNDNSSDNSDDDSKRSALDLALPRFFHHLIVSW